MRGEFRLADKDNTLQDFFIKPRIKKAQTIHQGTLSIDTKEETLIIASKNGEIVKISLKSGVVKIGILEATNDSAKYCVLLCAKHLNKRQQNSYKALKSSIYSI